jgi:hypothetical protein
MKSKNLKKSTSKSNRETVLATVYSKICTKVYIDVDSSKAFDEIREFIEEAIRSTYNFENFNHNFSIEDEVCSLYFRKLDADEKSKIQHSRVNRLIEVCEDAYEIEN